MRRKYLVLLLIPLVIALAGCGKKKYVAPPPEPNAPSNLTATVISYKQINLSWQDNSTTEDGFRVCCDMGGNQYQTVATLSPNATQFEHFQLQPMTEYTYFVQSYRGEEYANSKEVSATTPCPVEILDSRISGHSIMGVVLNVKLKNNATERCETEMTATFYDKDGIEYDSQTETPTLAGGEIRTVEFSTYRYGLPGGWNPLPGYSIEIIKAEILY